MVLEVAILNVRDGKAVEFQAAFAEAQSIISGMPGYISHELRRCVETANQYILLVRWQRLKDHTEGFRQSSEYEDWKRLLHHFYEPFPTVEHYEEMESQHSPTNFTKKQGQYLAFIYYYTKVNGKAPAEADIRRYFGVTPPSVHQMLVTLEHHGFVTRIPGRGRSIELCLRRHQLPELE